MSENNVSRLTKAAQNITKTDDNENLTKKGTTLGQWHQKLVPTKNVYLRSMMTDKLLAEESVNCTQLLKDS